MRPLLASLLFLASAAGLRAGGESFSSGPNRVSLIELYTSEGCSSCPPAERWLAGLRDSAGLWTDYVPVAFHVDYWDHLGWKDKFASSPFTRRQYAYSERWGASNVYTPCFVRDGAEWRPSGSAPEGAGAAGGQLSVTASGADTYRIRFVPAPGAPRHFDGHVALLGGGIHSRVTAGENDGSTLAHEFTVITLKDAGLSAAADGQGFEATLHLPAPSDKLAPHLSLAAWVTPAGSLEPLQATGGWLKR